MTAAVLCGVEQRPRFSLSTLGQFRLELDGSALPAFSTKKARAVLTYLVLNRNRDISREQLLETFWPEFDPDRARDNLKVTVWSIRRTLRGANVDANEVLRSDRSVVRWLASVDVDVEQLRELGSGHAEDAVAQASAMYHGDFLAGDYDAWASAERSRIAALYESILSRASATDRDTAANGRQNGGEFFLPFVARDAELRHLGACFDNARSQIGSLTLICGEAGIGKSALLREARIAAGNQGLRIVNVTCAENEFRAFGEWFETFQSLTGQSLLEFVRNIPGDTVAAVSRAIVSAIEQATLLCIDDAHNLGDASFAMLVAIVSALRMSHCVVIGSRTEGVPRFHRSKLAPGITEMQLAPLDEEHVASALRQATGVNPEGLASAVYQRSGGHPLYVVKLIESLIDNGVLSRDERGWHVRNFSGTLELPATLRKLIETRLTSRGPLPAAVASALALEPSAVAEDLRAALGVSNAPLLDALDDLLALDVIHEPNDGPQFVFSHDLVREVACGMLNAGRRTIVHRAFARMLGERHERDGALRIARHWAAAGEGDAALRAYVESANEALNWNANRDAAERCSEGLSCAEQLERSKETLVLVSQLQAILARAKLAVADFDGALEAATHAVDFARRAHDQQDLLIALLSEARVRGWISGPGALPYAEEAASLARTLENPRALAGALLECSIAATRAGHRELGVRSGGEAEAVASRAEIWEIAQFAAGWVAVTSATWWEFGDAHNYLARSKESALKADDASRALHHWACAIVGLLLGHDTEAAREHGVASLLAAKAMQSAESGGREVLLGPLLLMSNSFTAELAIEAGRYDEAISVLRATLDTQACPPAPRECATLMHIEALLARNSPGDLSAASERHARLSGRTYFQSALGFSRCPELAAAGIAAYSSAGDAATRLRQALDSVEQHAHATPLLADHAFKRLAEYATAADGAQIALRATERANFYHARRLHAAASATQEKGVVS